MVPGHAYHVVGTYDGTTQRLYVNGSQVASSAFSGAMSVNTNPVVVGSWDTASEFFNGTVDDVAVYAKTLSGAQITNHFTKGAGSAPASRQRSPLVCRWSYSASNTRHNSGPCSLSRPNRCERYP